MFQTVLPQPSGFLALTEVLEPYIVLSALAAVPFALIGRTRAAIILSVALALVASGRYGPGLTTGPVEAAGVDVTVTAWNVEAGGDGAQRVLAGLDGVTSDLIGLEELQPAMAAAVTSDAALAGAYPYRALSPDTSVLGVGLLSRYPIVDQWFSATSQPRSASTPPFMRAVVTVPDTPPIAVYVVHPLPGRFQSFFGLPTGIDMSERNAAIAHIREKVAADLDAHMSVIVMGDINTTPREPAYRELRAGLFDARDYGAWPGLTWRLDPFRDLPIGLLRIDYVFSSSVPSGSSVRCTSLSDHCLISAELGFTRYPL